jgi:hypothetical protein
VAGAGTEVLIESIQNAFPEEADRIVAGLRRKNLFVLLLLATACAHAGWMLSRAHAEVIANESFGYPGNDLDKAQGGIGWTPSAGWKTSTADTQNLCDENLSYAVAEGFSLGGPRAVGIHGTGERNNPLRRQLQTPFAGNELFIRFLLRYHAASVDTVASGGDGEFFVLWLDDLDGGDGADHNPNVPNIGLSVRTKRGQPVGDKKNYFMVRIGAENTTFSPIELKGDRTYLLVARLAKTQPGPLGAFDRLELWVDPKPGDYLREPDAISLGRGSNTVGWVGFGTGKRTEADDTICVDELTLGQRWSDVVSGADPTATAASFSIEKPKVENTSNIPPEKLVDFRRDVFPILRDRCFSCHQGADADSGHRLDQHDEVIGLNQGKALAIAKDSKNSPLYQVLIDKDEKTRMPQGEDPLPEREIAILQAWIDQGLAWDESLLPSMPLQSDHPLFQPVKRPEVPKVRGLAEEPRASVTGETGTVNPIDAFIAQKHAELELKPAPSANRRTLLRRITLDLTGLPPTPEELAAFLTDKSSDALRKVIDRLLSSNAYGERWARHWLDIARWAESDGYQQNFKRPYAWRYRDYVINAFAKNKSYDEFLRQQIAGDEMSPYKDENIIATGFLAATRYSGNEPDQAIQRQDILVDITNTTTSAVLGLTVQCAQCHNHKFDPITARDYYQFLGFFVKGQPVDLLLQECDKASAQNLAAVVSAAEELNELLYSTRARIEANQRKRGPSGSATQNAVVGAMSAEQKKRLEEINQQLAGHERTWAYYSPATSPHRLAVPFLEKTSPLAFGPELLQHIKPMLLYRGDLDSPGPEVNVSWPVVFGPAPEKETIAERPRTALVDWMTDQKNPLTARVWVNRLWQYHFGHGLVSTPDDFGTQGSEPTHPELLDWLAAELMESGWDTGHIQRLILESKTYQQSSQFSKSCDQIDPENRYYWRWLPRRLEAEAIRDSMLLVSGLLDQTVGGASVPLKERDASIRRTIYLEQKRGDLPHVQQLFDAPSTLTCCGRRRNSTVPLQPLFLLNNPETLRYAEALAKRVVETAGADTKQQVTQAFDLALGRPPNDQERETMVAFLVDHASRAAAEKLPADAGLVQLCQGLMNLNEFLYIP